MKHVRLAVALVLALANTVPAVTSEPLRVRANPALLAAIAPATDAFTRATGIPVALEPGEPDPPSGADVVVGDDTEMTRLLEGGLVDERAARDLGDLPWVWVAPAGVATSSALASGSVAVLGGAAGREARELLRAVPPERVHASRDAIELASARVALVPLSLAGPGEHRPADVRPLVATVAPVVASTRGDDARALIDFLQGPAGRATLARVLVAAPHSAAVASTAFGASVADWWIPKCSLEHNGYNDPLQLLGAPDAVNLGGKDHYSGIVSLGQGGWIVVALDQAIVDKAGPDVRVFQATSGEPVSAYAAASPQGPFVPIGLREFCGVRSPGLFANHCDFDLAGSGLASARYLKVEDGEIYPCLAGSTLTEGADIDAIQVLNGG